MSLDGIDMVLQANIDGTLGSITLVRSADSGAQDKAIDDARKIFGDPRPDTRTTMHQSKWGIVGTTDTCGRPVTPSPTPSSPA
ncbi:MAG: hypothetical protein ABI282_05685 [Candidatus Baltobacteraceae bacterium]